MSKTGPKDTKMFAWYESYTRAIDELPNMQDKAVLALALIEYGTYGKEPMFFKEQSAEVEEKLYRTCPKFAFKSIFETCRVNLDNSRASYEKGYRGASAGKKGGRPRKGETAAEAAARRQEEAQAAQEAAVMDEAEAALAAAQIMHEQELMDGLAF